MTITSPAFPLPSDHPDNQTDEPGAVVQRTRTLTRTRRVVMDVPSEDLYLEHLRAFVAETANLPGDSTIVVPTPLDLSLRLTATWTETSTVVDGVDQ